MAFYAADALREKRRGADGLAMGFDESAAQPERRDTVAYDDLVERRRAERFFRLSGEEPMGGAAYDAQRTMLAQRHGCPLHRSA